MSAPTAKLSAVPTAQPVPQHIEEEEEVLINPSGSVPADEAMDTTEEAAVPVPASNSLTLDQDGKPRFASVAESGKAVRFAQRNIPIPPHRFTPLKASWAKIYQPLVEHLHLQVRMDVRNKKIQIRTCKLTTDPGAIQKGDDFIRAFNLGFDIDDAIALLRLNDLFVETFEVKDVKTLTGDHLSRAIGRIAGKDGKTKFAIENASRTRVVLADSKIHILGGFENIKIARETIVSLILGAPPGKIYGNLRIISSRLKERF
ncbi:hypothetical protein D0Z00_003553 [Geotrichum galactomycetum]|uniref:Uncharacterized protein n=1 Tax=Geotrichum galactomycetum TaxID=27317 RepID=A0ACB6V121_9ASCO|nr:hypothetical protein D0Z00_003553 [Geotrichum candidum]